MAPSIRLLNGQEDAGGEFDDELGVVLRGDNRAVHPVSTIAARHSRGYATFA